MSSNAKRFVVLDTQGHVQTLTDLLEFVVSKNNEHGFKPITKHTSLTIVQSLAEHAVAWRSVHNNVDDPELKIMEALFGPVPGSQYPNELKENYRQLQEEPMWVGVVTDIEQQVAHHLNYDSKVMGNRTLIEWRVVKVANLVGLAEGDDYRISEYNRMTNATNDNEQSILTMDNSNPINYLVSKFMAKYANRLTQMQFMAANNIRLDQSLNRGKYEQMAKLIQDILERPDQLMAQLYLEVLTTMYPMIGIDRSWQPIQVQSLHCLGMWDFDNFKTNVVQRVISGYGLAYFSTYLDRNKRYKVEYSSYHIIAVYEDNDFDMETRMKHDLVQSLLNGDWLKESDRREAERLFYEMNN